jgi:hypothetical protein
MGFFKHCSYFGNIDDDWRIAFPIHQDIIISKIPDIVRSQITQLLTQ